MVKAKSKPKRNHINSSASNEMIDEVLNLMSVKQISEENWTMKQPIPTVSLQIPSHEINLHDKDD